ncbi:hypothetical protein DFH08DRAFT_812243 [Mycena albidolilacea]|uniref:Uncharacterized protein n=1 Tax=Mycena albidolilacea TaxID=1033008 RepID=A0AAD7EN34_9AGAR|nr:hypothetical protein DFH08DRAFT_812243 [Mycena albidolilacea]
MSLGKWSVAGFPWASSNFGVFWVLIQNLPLSLVLPPFPTFYGSCLSTVMSSSLHSIALAWNLRFRFFLDPSTSPCFLLDWDHHNADGTHLVLGYGMENFRTPRQFFHKRSDTALLEVYSGPVSSSRGVVGPEPVHCPDLLLQCCLAMSCLSPVGVRHLPFFQFLNQALAPSSHPLPTFPVFEFQANVRDYPQEWSLDTIVHQHFLACAWLRFWCIEERGPARWPIQICWLQCSTAATLPAMFNKLLDRMLFELILNMEHTLFWMSCLDFWVALSVHYNQLLEQLFLEVLSDFPPAQRQAEFTCLHARLFFSCNPSSMLPEDVQSDINPLDAPTGITRLCLIPWEGSSSDVRSRFQLDPSSNIAARLLKGSFQTWRPQTDGGFLQRNSHPPGTSSRVKRLDLEIAATGLSPSGFLGATLPPSTSVVEVSLFRLERRRGLADRPPPNRGPTRR